jgi:hypothetical protein
MLPILSILFLSVITLPMSLMDFGFLVNWSGFLGALTQICQVAIFLALRVPSYVEKMRQQPTEDEEGILENMLFAPGDEGATAPSAEADIDNKFIIGGGWPVAILLSTSLAGSCVFLIIESGWESALATVAYMVIVLGVKGAEWGIRRCCRKRRAVQDPDVRTGEEMMVE